MSALNLFHTFLLWWIWACICLLAEKSWLVNIILAVNLNVERVVLTRLAIYYYPIQHVKKFLLLTTSIAKNEFLKFNNYDNTSILKALCNLLHVKLFVQTWFTEPTQNRNFRWSWNFWPLKGLEEIRLRFSSHDCFVINKSFIVIVFLQSSVTLMMMASNPHHLANGFCCVIGYLILFVWKRYRKIWFSQHGVVKNSWDAKKYRNVLRQKLMFLVSGAPINYLKVLITS